jgi:hypothetical protein
MKRSSTILLGAVLLSAISSCDDKPKDQWIVGAGHDGKTRDTVINNAGYRYYGGGWYPIHNGFISPASYHQSTIEQIRTPGYTPSHIRTGGFGSSSHSSVGE